MLPNGVGSDAPRCTLAVEQDDDGAIAAVILQEPWESGVLYFDLEYDARLLSPLSAEPCVTAGEAENLVHLAVLSDRGVVHYGQVPRGDAALSPNKTGDVLVEARFEHKPCTTARVTSQPPTGVGSQVQLKDTYLGQLFWHYQNHGDYNNDGIVNINDLAPVGRYYGDIAEHKYFPPSDERWIVDGNQDGVINISDLTALGQNWGNSVLGGYRVYYSDTMEDYPAPASLENGPGAALLGSVGFAQMDHSVTPARFTMDIDPGLVDNIFWIRPVDSKGNEGIASTFITNLGLYVPRADEASAHAWWDTEIESLRWYYTNPGDFNQDGSVNIMDLTSVGFYWNEVSPGGIGTPFPEDSCYYVIDYDSNGIIDTGDIVAIGLYNGNLVLGYNLYESTDESYYPNSNDATSTLLPVYSHITMYMALDEYDSRLHFKCTLPDPEPGSFCWVRPYDYMGNEGTPSNLVVIPE